MVNQGEDCALLERWRGRQPACRRVQRALPRPSRQSRAHHCTRHPRKSSNCRCQALPVQSTKPPWHNPNVRRSRSSVYVRVSVFVCQSHRQRVREMNAASYLAAISGGLLLATKPGGNNAHASMPQPPHGKHAVDAPNRSKVNRLQVGGPKPA